METRIYFFNKNLLNIHFLLDAVSDTIVVNKAVKNSLLTLNLQLGERQAINKYRSKLRSTSYDIIW